ncbi:HupE/UreJ family protein [Chamaesiphon sp. OTE_8_metabat_110]|uniref:HupE/UreJ family protein n=1 Tax=Chamaesiphon sp. OTE_8_metabat_110 TaxID=2964696 RepID=UPI00286A2225|nr:HupE/UreJ family protein [Chamaesiphon sp. OTE_8_metabat_110]
MKKNQFWQYLVSAIAITLLLPSLASAHTGVGDSGGYWQGLVHPFSGLDHILAMVAVGLWAAQIGGKALWVVPSAFMLAMAGSSVAGYFGLPLPGVEQGILASDFILGLLLLFAARLPLAISTGIVASLAIFHGYAHGAEMPATASGLSYGFGFIISTATLHLAGIGLGLTIVGEASPLENRYQPKFKTLLFRFGGGAVILGAVYISIAG